MAGLTPGHMLLILIVALIVIGPGKLPEVGAAIGKSFREFQKASGDIQGSLMQTLGTPPAQAPTQPPAVAPAQPPAPQPPAQSYYAQPGQAQQPYAGQPYPQPAYAPQPAANPAQPYVAAPEYPTSAPSSPAQSTAPAPAPDTTQTPAGSPRVDQ